MNNLNEKVEQLKDYFSKKPEVIMAFVFGSYAKGTNIQESDFDVAVYFKPEGKEIEWEETKIYKDEDKIWGDIEKIVGIKTDLIVLNRAPSTLAYSVINTGIPVIVKDRAFLLRFSLLVGSASEYFNDFVKDFWVIKQRSASLNEIDKIRLIRLVDFLESEIKDWEKFKILDKKIYETDIPNRRNTERWAENIVNSSIDIAKIILASEGKKIPQTYKEILQNLSFVEGFDSQAAEKLSNFAKLRNVLAHEYLDIRFQRISDLINNAEAIYGELIKFTKDLIRKEN